MPDPDARRQAFLNDLLDRMLDIVVPGYRQSISSERLRELQGIVHGAWPARPRPVEDDEDPEEGGGAGR